jgi:hypothetical protein
LQPCEWISRCFQNRAESGHGSKKKARHDDTPDEPV